MLRGANSPEELVAAAKARGMRALALTDTNGLYAAVPFYQAARQAGLKPILGTEVDTPQHRAVLLARDLKGYRQICRIITDRHMADDFDLASSLLREGTEHVFVLSKDECLLSSLAGNGLNDVYVELPADSGPEASAALASHLDLPMVATSNVHFISPNQECIHRTLSAIRLAKPLAALGSQDTASSGAWLKPPELIERELNGFPEAVGNAGRIADECNAQLQLGAYHFPVFDTPNANKPEDFLRKTALDGLKRRYGQITASIRARFEKEVDLITSMGFASYFLTVWDIVRFAHAHGISSAGKGSAASSLIAYALGITDVEPLRFNLYFERFLNPERKDPPDIDVDFSWRRRDEVVDYVIRRYGADRTAMICTFNCFGYRSALREVAKAYGLGRAEINALVRHAENSKDPSEAGPLSGEPFNSILSTARSLRNHPRHLSIHAGGIVIAPGKISDFVPVQRSRKGVAITQFDMNPIEDIGLIKIDLLGQRSLAVFEDTLETVRQSLRLEVDLCDLPEDDKETVDLLRNGKTIGCFQIESPGMRALLQKLQVDNLPILVAASSVIRPGPADSGMMRAFIHRYLGHEQPEYLHPVLENILHETYGVMLYQEDVLKVAQEVGGMSLGEADDLRRSMTKKRGYEGIKDSRERFLAGAHRKGFDPNVAKAIWKQIESFAGYAFCKAHSAAYSILAYQAVYLKAHYPAAFLAAVLTNQGGFYDASVYIGEARHLGLTILPPDVNLSQQHFTAEGKAIRVGLMQVRSLTQSTVKAMFRERRHRLFDNLADFSQRVRCRRRELKNLIMSGAMDSFGLKRPELMWQLEQLPVEREKQERGYTLFKETVKEQSIPPYIRDYSLKDKLAHETAVLGFAVTAHPLALFREMLDRKGVVHSNSLSAYVGQMISVAGRVISTKSTRTTDRGEEMLFLTIEDEFGTLEIVFFPAAYRRLRRSLRGCDMVMITGRVQNDDGALTVTAERTAPLAQD